jgi:tRNA nucleotidyltransferase/poly(A) polymerase
MKSFKDYLVLKEAEESQGQKDWRKEYVTLEKGFNPKIHSPNLSPIIDAFQNSSKIPLTKDTTKDVTMPKKSLFLVGGAVRDFLKNKTPKDFDLATNATPAQMARILHEAGFKVPTKGGQPDYDRSGKGGEFHLGFEPELAKPGDKKLWMLTGRDSSKGRKPFVLTAVVDGQSYEIATFRRDAKVSEGQAIVDFVDNPNEDAERRDLTINAMYIELTNPDGDNKRLFDPTKKGWHDVTHGIVRTVGKARERFGEDPLRTLRAIRFHCRFGSGWKMHDDIEEAMPEFRHLDGAALERVKDEFEKGLIHPDVDPRCYLSIYKRTGLIDKVFPNVNVNINVPASLRDKKDKILSLAWILQDNPISKVEEVLGSTRGDIPTGWSKQERNAISFLLNLKYFDPDMLGSYIQKRKGTGLSPKQIRDWTDIIQNSKGEARGLGGVGAGGPRWAKYMHALSEFDPNNKELVTWQEKIPCDQCKGDGCEHCEHRGYHKGGIHPDIISRGLAGVAPTQRASAVENANKARLKDLFFKQPGL